MATPRPASFDYTLQSRGKEAQMKLIGLSIQSLLFGTYLTLALAMFYLLRHRRAGWASTSTTRHPTKGRLLVGLCILTTTLTGVSVQIMRGEKCFIDYKHNSIGSALLFDPSKHSYTGTAGSRHPCTTWNLQAPSGSLGSPFMGQTASSRMPS